jgi:hypothetical protein
MHHLHGIYVANVYDEDEGQVVLNQLKTMVTYDFGGEWTRLQPPVNDSLGNPIQCNPGEVILTFFSTFFFSVISHLYPTIFPAFLRSKKLSLFSCNFLKSHFLSNVTLICTGYLKIVMEDSTVLEMLLVSFYPLVMWENISIPRQVP